MSRILGRLLHFEPLGPYARMRRGFANFRLFLYELVAVLSVLVLATAVARLVILGRHLRLAARIALGVVAAPLILLTAAGAVVELPADLFFELQMSFCFFGLLVTLNAMAAPASWRPKLGLFLVYLPIALEFAARFIRRTAEAPELHLAPLALDRFAERALAFAALATVPLFADVGRARQLALALAAALVGALAVLFRFDWETLSRVSEHGFGVTLPLSPGGGALLLAAVGAFVFSVTTLLSTDGPTQLRGWGLALLGLAGFAARAPFHATLASLGLLCLSESLYRGARPAMTSEDFDRLVRGAAAALGAGQVVRSGPLGNERVRLHAPVQAGHPVSVEISRQRGHLAQLRVHVGEALERQPPFTLQRRGTPRLGPRADGGALTTGDAAFDRAFLTHDRRGLNVKLLDDETRAALGRLCSGWIAVWPQRGVAYRAAFTTEPPASDGLALSELVALLRSLYDKAA